MYLREIFLKINLCKVQSTEGKNFNIGMETRCKSLTPNPLQL